MTQASAAPDSKALLGRLLRRMNEAGGFPALDQSVAVIVDALDQGDEDTTPLINAVLADVSLTQKVLRLANSAMYAPIARDVSTVSHAVMVLGFEAVGHLALGAKLIGSMGDLATRTPGASQALAQSLLAGSMASSVVSSLDMRGGELGVVCSLLYRLGRLLTAFFLPEEWSRIEALVRAGQEESEAAKSVLGMTLEDLGAQMARQWRLPPRIVQTMLEEGGAAHGEDSAWLAALARYSDQSAQILCTTQGEEAGRRQQALAAEFGPKLGCAGEDLLQAANAAATQTGHESLLAKIFLARPESEEDPSETADGESENKETPRPAVPATPLARLQLGLRDVRQAVVEGGTAMEITRTALEAAHSALELDRSAVFLLDTNRRVYVARATLAAKGSSHLEHLSMDLSGGSDLAQVALVKKVDIYIDNPRGDKAVSHLPAWVRSHSLHPFFLLPMTTSGGTAIGLIFGQQRDDTRLTKPELATLAILRDLLQARLRKG